MKMEALKPLIEVQNNIYKVSCGAHILGPIRSLEEAKRISDLLYIKLAADAQYSPAMLDLYHPLSRYGVNVLTLKRIKTVPLNVMVADLQTSLQRPGPSCAHSGGALTDKAATPPGAIKEKRASRTPVSGSGTSSHEHDDTEAAISPNNLFDEAPRCARKRAFPRQRYHPSMPDSEEKKEDKEEVVGDGDGSNCSQKEENVNERNLKRQKRYVDDKTDKDASLEEKAAATLEKRGPVYLKPQRLPPYKGVLPDEAPNSSAGKIFRTRVSINSASLERTDPYKSSNKPIHISVSGINCPLEAALIADFSLIWRAHCRGAPPPSDEDLNYRAEDMAQHHKASEMLKELLSDKYKHVHTMNSALTANMRRCDFSNVVDPDYRAEIMRNYDEYESVANNAMSVGNDVVILVEDSEEERSRQPGQTAKNGVALPAKPEKTAGGASMRKTARGLPSLAPKLKKKTATLANKSDKEAVTAPLLDPLSRSASAEDTKYKAHSEGLKQPDTAAMLRSGSAASPPAGATTVCCLQRILSANPHITQNQAQKFAGKFNCSSLDPRNWQLETLQRLAAAGKDHVVAEFVKYAVMDSATNQ